MVARDDSSTRHPGDRFIKVAIAILGETGRTDFTVGQVVARAKASLRAFYQHFDTKDDLLLALSGRVIETSARAWRAEVADLRALPALRLLVDRIGAAPVTDRQHAINQALGLYYEQLAHTRPTDFAKLLAPLHGLVVDVVRRGVDDGVVDPSLDVVAVSAVILQTMFGAQRIHSLAELAGSRVDDDLLYDFCVHGLLQCATTGKSHPTD